MSKQTAEIRPEIVAVFVRHLITLHRIASLEKKGEASLPELRAKQKATELLGQALKGLTDGEKSLVKTISGVLGSGRIDLTDRNEYIAKKVMEMCIR